MCDVCTALKIDSKFINGPKYKNPGTTCALYKVTAGRLTYVKLCYIHRLELFLLGETRFLRSYLVFAKGLASKESSKSDSIY